MRCLLLILHCPHDEYHDDNYDQNYYQQIQFALGQMHGVDDLVIILLFPLDYLPLVMLK